MRELAATVATARLGNVGFARPVGHSKGGKQGGKDTPDIWNRLLAATLGKLPRQWRARGWCVRIVGADGGCQDCVLCMLLWADNMFLLAPHKHQMLLMLKDVHLHLAAVGMKLKAGEITMMHSEEGDVGNMDLETYEHATLGT